VELPIESKLLLDIMKQRNHNSGQIVRKLHEDDWMLGEGPWWLRSVITRGSLSRPTAGGIIDTAEKRKITPSLKEMGKESPRLHRIIAKQA
jgi:hypothetical protein